MWGAPISKARPRAARRGGRIHIYTPTAGDEQRIATDLAPFRGAMLHAEQVEIAFIIHGAHGSQDADNICKLYLDALVKAAVIRDDNIRRVPRLLIEARPLEGPGEPRVTIYIKPLKRKWWKR